MPASTHFVGQSQLPVNLSRKPQPRKEKSLKLTTIVREQQDRSAVVVDLPLAWEGKDQDNNQPTLESSRTPNPPPAGLARYYLDVGLAVDVLQSAQERLRWPAGLTFPKMQVLAPQTRPLKMRHLLAGGPSTLAALGDLVEAVRLLTQQGDGAIVGDALVPAHRARLRTPVPDSPLFFVFHGNAVIVWRRQVGIDPTQHIMTRIPAMRIRTINSLLGQDEPLYLPSNAELSYGNELGFVIGKEARDVPAEKAYGHVAGYVCTNDCYSNVYSLLAPNAPNRISSTLQVGDKSTDGCGPVGPWIATPDEVGDPHDLILLTRQDGVLRNRSHSGSYIVGVEEAIERLSHQFPLMPGTIVTLGAAGWDGITDEPRDRPSGRSILEVEVERVGTLRTPLVYPESGQQENRKGGSPYLFAGTVEGTTPLDRLDSETNDPTILPGIPSPKGFWMLFGNQKDAKRLEIEQTDSPEVPAAVAYPVTSLRLASTMKEDQKKPTLIKARPNAGTIHVACHLAIVIGAAPAYAENAASAITRVAGYTTLLSVHDSGTLERLALPTTDYERRFATFFGYCTGGHHILANGTPIDVLKDSALEAGRSTVLSVGNKIYAANTASYRHSPAAVVRHLSHALTLLPGDVIGLGPIGPAIQVSDEQVTIGVQVKAAIEGLAPLSTILQKEVSVSG